MRCAGAMAALLLLAVAGTTVQALEVTGDLSLQPRWYPQSPAWPGQRSGTVGLVLEPTLYTDITATASVTLTPYYRFDSADSRRTHEDVREAYLLTYGQWGEHDWELRLGVDRVFWGVAEVHNLVDIINQVDLVEHPRDRPKLGQPMAHLTLSGDWGLAEAFVLPYHRKRTYPGHKGRMRSRHSIDEHALYESGARARHVDAAFRYSHALGVLDFGLSTFVGTSREPSFVVQPRTPTDLSLVPYYGQIRQYGIDAQLTTDPWLYKLEAIYRTDARNLLGQEEDYGAFIVGFERALYGVLDSSADLTLLAEWLYDERGARAISAWQHDLFLSGFLALNDVPGTEILVGLLSDLRYETRILNMEIKRRLKGNWSMRLESFVNLQVDRKDLTYDGQRDSFVGAELTYSF
ncbi:MAG: hypothetical protein OXC42_00130 [Gammaproteobacteria bacterium]|nr:hypothetical protein [Gammaproteobacteria bacterium]